MSKMYVYLMSVHVERAREQYMKELAEKKAKAAGGVATKDSPKHHKKKKKSRYVEEVYCLPLLIVLLVFVVFSVRLLSVLRGHSGFSSPPQRPMTSDFEGFLYQILSITLFSYLNSWERASISLFQCWVLNKGVITNIIVITFKLPTVNK